MVQVTVDRLRQMLVENCMVKIAPEAIEEDTALFGPDSLGLDSLDALQMVIAVEKEYKVMIGDPAAARDALQSLSVLRDYIERKMADQNSAVQHELQRSES
jgi:acyl carrier protein